MPKIGKELDNKQVKTHMNKLGKTEAQPPKQVGVVEGLKKSAANAVSSVGSAAAGAASSINSAVDDRVRKTKIGGKKERRNDSMV